MRNKKINSLLLFILVLFILSAASSIKLNTVYASSPFHSGSFRSSGSTKSGGFKSGSFSKAEQDINKNINKGVRNSGSSSRKFSVLPFFISWHAGRHYYSPIRYYGSIFFKIIFWIVAIIIIINYINRRRNKF